MPVINVDDLTDQDKAKMEVDQLKIEVKLERALVRLIVLFFTFTDNTVTTENWAVRVTTR